MTRLLWCAVLLVACERPANAPADRPAADDDTTATPAAPAEQGAWPEPGHPIDLRRERPYDLTQDGRAEIVSVTARGARYDSLVVALTIAAPAGDTLWHEQWPSLLYFAYDPREGKADSTVMRIVRGHVDTLLAADRFSPAGLPAALRRGGDPDATMREAVTYYLAELDWRRSADLKPADETPPDAHSRIDASQVGRERVDVVVAELKERPSFMYYAGGEATYAVAWSEREQALVRIYSCC